EPPLLPARRPLHLLAARTPRLLGALRLRDAVADSLDEERGPALAAPPPRLASPPDDASVTGERAKFGAERPAGAAAAGELEMAALAIVGMKLPEPEERIAQPLLLREAEQRLDLRADVELVHVLVERRHERDGRALLGERAG